MAKKRKGDSERSFFRDIQGLIVLALALGGMIFLLVNNARNPISVSEVPTVPRATVVMAGTNSYVIDHTWEDAIQQQIVATVPTRPGQTIVPPKPTTPPEITGTPVINPDGGGGVALNLTATATRILPPTPSLAVPTAAYTPVPQLISSNNDPNRGQFSPPPEIVPMSIDPRDHYYFKRPLDSSANSEQIYWYPYGSDGPQHQWRVHAGIDLPNNDGAPVRAAAPGRVVWASNNYVWRDEKGNVADVAYSYGNVVVVEHDFGYRGQKLWTLYAHLSVIMVKVDQHVETDDVVGLSGHSGNVSGPHVHFEVRVGINNYFDTRNPILWMAPYLDHGVIAGRILAPNGHPIEGAPVYLTKNGRNIDQSVTYVTPHQLGQPRCKCVNEDDVWHENFAIGDVAAGTYVVMVNVNGVQFKQEVTVRAGTTSFVDFGTITPDGTSTDKMAILPK